MGALLQLQSAVVLPSRWFVRVVVGLHPLACDDDRTPSGTQEKEQQA